MIQLPGHLVARYQAYCRGCGINDSDRADYLKWLRFFLDFSEKYQITGEVETRIQRFLNKLQKKKQGEDRLHQAHHAVTLYFKMLQNNPGNQPMVPGGPNPAVQQTELLNQESAPPTVNTVRKSFYSEAGYQEKTSSPEWDGVIEKMAAEIKALKASQIAHKTPYSTRHTFCAWALTIGVNPMRMVNLMGHASKQMVYQNYGEYLEGLEDDVEDIMGYFGQDFLVKPQKKKSPLLVYGDSYGDSQFPIQITS